LKPVGGTITKDGVDIIDLPPAARNMGIVFQNYALFENMTVLQNVEYALKIRKENKSAEGRKQVRQRALAMIEQMGLSEHADKLPSMLSGGQQQRVAIARTMVLKPDVILFDEPLSALDVSTRLLMRREIKALQAESGVTMIYVTHDQEEAFAMSDRIMVMNSGQIEQIGTPEELIDHPKTDFVRRFVGENLSMKIRDLERFRRMDS
jgi:ABC-type Fe3+/spermidine/putrescine transport system ATPase subunit